LILQNSGLLAAAKNREDRMVVLWEIGCLKGIGGPFFLGSKSGENLGVFWHEEIITGPKVFAKKLL